MAPWETVLPSMACSAAKNTDWRKKQKEIPSQQGNIPSSTSPKKEKKPRSFFKPVSLVFAWGFPCFLFYLNCVCQSEGQVLNMSMARTARAFYSLHPWGEDGTHMPVAFLRFTHKQEIFGLSELPPCNLVGQCMRLWGEVPRDSGTEALWGTLQKTYTLTLFFSAISSFPCTWLLWVGPLTFLSKMAPGMN